MICFKQETFQTVLFYRMINAAQCYKNCLYWLSPLP